MGPKEFLCKTPDSSVGASKLKFCPQRQVQSRKRWWEPLQYANTKVLRISLGDKPLLTLSSKSKLKRIRDPNYYLLLTQI